MVIMGEDKSSSAASMAFCEKPLRDMSVVVLTYNRPERLAHSLKKVALLEKAGIELIVVDNCSELSAQEIADGVGVNAEVIRTEDNIGAAARNLGIERARGEIIITLDDDVSGLTVDDCLNLQKMFQNDASLGGLCFQVRDEVTDEQINWCHHRRIECWRNRSFETEEISEGAVAFRSTVVKEKGGLYPEEFFISHEGVVAAIRIMNQGYSVRYTPDVVVQHATERTARVSWRRYYYDTRNTLWLCVGFLPFWYAVKLLTRSTPTMLLYSVRDGYLRFWLKGVVDGLGGLGYFLKNREKPAKRTVQKLRDIQLYRPSVFYLIRRRLFRRGVRI